jgi:hypothetical protein
MKMSTGANAERVLASRLAALERLVDQAADEDAEAKLWAEYYVVLDLWLRLRAPVPATPPITRATLEAQFQSKAKPGRP